MIGMKLNQMKGTFFDRPKVMNAVDKGTRRVFSRFGAFVRTEARHSIRKRKRASKPGEPPSSHTGLLRRFIFFGYERLARSVVIGPVKLNSKNTGAPHVLEEGGSTQLSFGTRGKQRRINVKPRPYMGPAFEKVEPRLPEMWRNSVT